MMLQGKWRSRTALRIGLPGLAIVAISGAVVGCSSNSGGLSTSKDTIGIVEQQLANPFFAKLENSAVAAAKKAGFSVMTAESQTAGDSATQISAIQNMIVRKVKGIILDPANATALVPVVKQARDAGILVITVNTSLSPADTANASFETDNTAAGDLIGKWAKATLGNKQPAIAMLDYDLSDKTSAARHNGFLTGFGITSSSPEIVGTALTKADVPTGQSSMENLLSAHGNINTGYTINEPAAQGAAIAIKNKGLTDSVNVVSIDGSCSGTKSVQSGEIGATVMQFPTKMGELAVDAINTFVKNGTKPTGVHNSGTQLITDHPVSGVPSQPSSWGMKNCWGN